MSCKDRSTFWLSSPTDKVVDLLHPLLKMEEFNQNLRWNRRLRWVFVPSNVFTLANIETFNIKIQTVETPLAVFSELLSNCTKTESVFPTAENSKDNWNHTFDFALEFTRCYYFFSTLQWHTGLCSHHDFSWVASVLFRTDLNRNKWVPKK